VGGGTIWKFDWNFGAPKHIWDRGSRCFKALFAVMNEWNDVLATVLTCGEDFKEVVPVLWGLYQRCERNDDPLPVVVYVDAAKKYSALIKAALPSVRYVLQDVLHLILRIKEGTMPMHDCSEAFFKLLQRAFYRRTTLASGDTINVIPPPTELLKSFDKAMVIGAQFCDDKGAVNTFKIFGVYGKRLS
jgi:hypothetical protein